MTTVKLLADKSGIYGFEISGHSSSDCDDEQGKLICAAVSSVAYLTANTIIEVVGDVYNAAVEDAFMYFEVKNPSKFSSTILEGFRLHINELSKQYSNRIRIITEV